jgi:hypothetical protein
MKYAMTTKTAIRMGTPMGGVNQVFMGSPADREDLRTGSGDNPAVGQREKDSSGNGSNQNAFDQVCQSAACHRHATSPSV